MPERVERAGLDERLDRLLVAHADWNLVEEVVEVGEATGCPAALDDGGDDIAAHVADGSEAEPDVLAAGREVTRRLVDVRRQHLDAHPPAFIEVESSPDL